MKTFFLALGVFFLIICILFFAVNYIDKRCAELISAAKQFPRITPDDTDKKTGFNEDYQTAVNSFASIWKNSKKILYFLVGHDEADKIEEAFNDMRIRYTMKDFPGYMSARQKLLATIYHLSDSESITFDAIS